MPDERTFTLRQTDQVGTDLAIIADELEVIRARLAWIPTKADLARTALRVIFCSAVLVILWIELARHCLQQAAVFWRVFNIISRAPDIR